MKGARTTVDVGGVLHSGRVLDVREDLPLPDFGSYRFPAPASAELGIRRLGRGIEVLGRVEVEAVGECARCLDEVRLPLTLEIDETIEPGGSSDDPLAESNVLAGEELNLADLARQLIDSALPYVLVCDDGCRGLCIECGLKLNGACRCSHPE